MFLIFNAILLKTDFFGTPPQITFEPLVRFAWNFGCSFISSKATKWAKKNYVRPGIIVLQTLKVQILCIFWNRILGCRHFESQNIFCLIIGHFVHHRIYLHISKDQRSYSNSFCFIWGGGQAKFRYFLIKFAVFSCFHSNQT